MPCYFVTQPNGLYARWSTIVDGFCEIDMTEADCKRWYAEQRLTHGELLHQWQRVLDDVIPLQEDAPCCDQKPLRRWHDCLNMILHVHGTAKLAAFLSEYPETFHLSTYANEVAS